jgi:hypothetical protein
MGSSHSDDSDCPSTAHSQQSLTHLATDHTASVRPCHKRMTATSPLYSRPEFVRGEQCTIGASGVDRRASLDLAWRQRSARSGRLSAVKAQQPNRTSPYEPPRTRPTALRQWPASQGFVRRAEPPCLLRSAEAWRRAAVRPGRSSRDRVAVSTQQSRWSGAHGCSTWTSVVPTRPTVGSGRAVERKQGKHRTRRSPPGTFGVAGDGAHGAAPPTVPTTGVT